MWITLVYMAVSVRRSIQYIGTDGSGEGSVDDSLVFPFSFGQRADQLNAWLLAGDPA